MVGHGGAPADGSFRRKEDGVGREILNDAIEILDKSGNVIAAPTGTTSFFNSNSADGDVYVVKAGPALELLAKNAMGETLMATPAVSDGLIIFRGSKNVYAIKPR